MKTFKGGCLCGQISYSIEGELDSIILCHCNQCRKTSGHFVAATRTATEKIKITGAVTWFNSSSDARRGFCGNCGSQLFWQPGDRSSTSLFAGSLDGQTGLQIATQIHVEAKGDYYDLPSAPISDQRPIQGKPPAEEEADV